MRIDSKKPERYLLVGLNTSFQIRRELLVD
jgi:hypothetical protein